MSDSPLHSSRRTFLKSVVGTAAALIAPGSPALAGGSRAFWFLDVRTGDAWPVNDPAAWALQHSEDDRLARAAVGLRELTIADPQRVIRLVLRRCGLNLLELTPGRVDVHHWIQTGLADLRPFFRTHRLARPEIAVALRARKREHTTLRQGDEFLFGERLRDDWPWHLWEEKWSRRFLDDPDDRAAAPFTFSGLRWEGFDDDRIPWRALKAAWRRAVPEFCPNCDRRLIVSRFGLRQIGLFNTAARLGHICVQCRREFETNLAGPNRTAARAWLTAHLEPDCLPAGETFWGRAVGT